MCNSSESFINIETPRTTVPQCHSKYEQGIFAPASSHISRFHDSLSLGRLSIRFHAPKSVYRPYHQPRMQCSQKLKPLIRNPHGVHTKAVGISYLYSQARKTPYSKAGYICQDRPSQSRPFKGYQSSMTTRRGAASRYQRVWCPPIDTINATDRRHERHAKFQICSRLPLTLVGLLLHHGGRN